MSVAYLDSSAAVKLIIEEPHSAALVQWIADVDPDFVSCDLLRVEVLRTCRQHSPEALAAGRDRLDAVTLMPIDTALCLQAADIDPTILRALDALHLAAALALGDDLEAVVTYDSRLAAGCRAYGLPVIAPGT